MRACFKIAKSALTTSTVSYQQFKGINSVLYSGIRPETHSEGMFSWFPFYFPIKVCFVYMSSSLSSVLITAQLCFIHPKEPQYVTAGSTITCHFWRKCTPKKVWYEWCMSKPAPVPLHNPGGRSYLIGL